MAEHQGVEIDRGSSETALPADLRPIFGVAMVEATNRGSAAVEAEHLLLALLFARTGAAAKVLADRGLTYAAFTDALRQEREQTLARIGVAIPEPTRLQAAPRVRLGRPRISASAKEAFERATRLRGARRGRGPRMSDLDFALGLLSAELGTVPRALARAGFDRQALVDAIDDAVPTARREVK